MNPHRPRYNVLIPTRHGMMVVNRNDWSGEGEARCGVGNDLMETGEYMPGELEELRRLIGLCPADPVILDIGANIGVHALFFSELAGPRGRVHAFEAQRIVFQMLMGNLALNSIENVHGHCVALGRAPGALKLPPVDYSRPWNFGGMGLAKENPAPQFGSGTPEWAAADRNETIPLITVDSLKLERADFIKLDVEGMEEDVLRGAAYTLGACRPLMQVEWWGHDGGSLPLYLLEHLEYRVFQAAQNLICIPAERSPELYAGSLPEMRAADVKQAYKLT
ncbi:MAG: FkbM family methyltransferase [Betaproteobacteria bacterium]|nr:FkbM family methyltransferase [Betaproteobacteria bacterium]